MHRKYFILIILGALTPNQTYTSPLLSIHTYNESSKKTIIDYGKMRYSNKEKFNQQSGTLATSKEENLSSDETVIMVPVEDIINIYYTTDTTRNVKAQEHSRLVPVVGKKRCGFCSCGEKRVEPETHTEIVEAKYAQRTITIHIQYSKYSNLDSVSHTRILSESDRTLFYKNQFQPKETLKFYLVRNTEYHSNNFEEKKTQAENLCRIIMQLKGMNAEVMRNYIHSHAKENTLISSLPIRYPNPQELQQIMNQSCLGVIGDKYEEREHSVETRQDFGTHVPVPVTTIVVKSLEMKTKDDLAKENT